jgi:hypothetical protein
LTHVLARYVTASSPPVVLEELVPVTSSVWDDGTPPAPDVLLAGPVAAAPYTARDVAEAAEELLDHDDQLRAKIEAELEQRRVGIAERHSRLDGAWAAGLEDVRVASWDPVAISILFPSA